MQYQYDLIILGSGPAGFSCAMQASKFDKKVLLIEKDAKHLGGAWINSGTVPSKALKEAAENIFKFTQQFGDVGGKKPYLHFQMRDLLKMKNKVIDHENSEIKRNLIKNMVHTARGTGEIVDAHTVRITDHTGKQKDITTRFILIATGSRVMTPKNFKIDHKIILNGASVMNMSHVPRRLVICGTGVYPVEYGTTFAALGTKVTILNLEEEFLPFLDKEILGEFEKCLSDLRINVLSGISVKGIEFNLLRNCGEVRYTQSGSDELNVVESEQVLFFGRRKPNTGEIGLDNAGVKVDRSGFVKVNEHFRSSAKNIYAAGDVIGFPGLASSSFHQGRIAACDMFEADTSSQDFHIPYGIYSIPEIASVGYTEGEAEKAGLNVTVGRAYFNALTKASITNNKRGMLKLVVENETLKLVGVHIIGESACDLVHLGQSIIAKKGDVRYFIDNILNYPTFSEAYRVAAFNAVNRVFKQGVKYKKILERKKD